MSFLIFFTPGLLLLVLLLGWLLKRGWVGKQPDGESTSEEMLAELESAYLPRRRVEIRTQTEYLPFLLETLCEMADEGFGDRQLRMMLHRMNRPESSLPRRALFPILSRGRRSELDLSWTLDDSGRIRLFVLAAPELTRALRHHARRMPGASPVASGEGR